MRLYDVFDLAPRRRHCRRLLAVLLDLSVPAFCLEIM